MLIVTNTVASLEILIIKIIYYEKNYSNHVVYLSIVNDFMQQ